MMSIQYPKVEVRPVYIPGRLNAPHAQVKSLKSVALVNPDTDYVYSVNSDRYRLVKHEWILEPVMETLVRNNVRFAPAVCFPDNGAKMLANLTLLDYQVEVRKGDFVHPVLQVYGSFDLSWASRFAYSAWRQLCSNGMGVGFKFDIIRKIHNQVFNPEDAIEMVRNAEGVFVEQGRIWREWAETMALPEDYERFLAPLRLSDRDINRIHSEVEVSSDKTLDDLKLRTLDKWTLFNIITQFLTHRVRNQVRQAELFNRLRIASA